MSVPDYKINYKSDFVLNINGDAGWAVPFCIKFWTGMPSQAYFVGFDGVKYVNCRVGDTPTQLLVMFDDHHLPIGQLRMQIAYHTTIDEFPGSVFDEVTNARDVIVTIDGTDYQVMLDFTGEDAPELEFDLPAYANEAERIQNELQRQQNEADRIAAELQREQATAAAVQGAENVNAQLNGTTLTVTNRLGVSTSVNTKGEQGEQGPVGPQGETGETGPRGTSIVSFTPKSTTATTLIYTVTFSDGTTQDVAIPKGAKGDTGATGPQGPQGDTGVSITAFTYASETETDMIYTVTFSDSTTQQVAIPKGAKGDTGPQGPVGPQGPQGPMGDVAVITPEQQAAFTMYSTTGQNTNGPMTQKAVTDALGNIAASGVSYDNSQSGLASDNVQGALDELSQNVEGKEITPSNGFYSTKDVDTHGAIPSTPNTSGNNGLWYRCAKIEVNTGDVLLVSGAGSGYAAGRLWAFGDSNGNYMYGSEVSGTQTTVSLIIPEGVKWVVLNSKASANIEWYYAKRGSVYANILLEQQAINELISNTETTSLEPVSVDYGNINGGYVSSSDGNIVQTPISTNYPYRYTNLIAVTKGQQIDTVVLGSASVLTIAAYSSSNTTTAIISKSEVGNGTVQEKRYIVPEGVDYVRISFQSTHIIQFYVNIHNVSALNEKVDNLNDKVENIKKDILAFPIEPLETYAAKEYHDGTLSTVPNAICKKYDVENLDYVFVTTQWQSVDAGFYLVVFTDSSNATLSQLAPNQRNTGLTLTKQKFIIPDGAKYMYVNNRYGVDMPIAYRDNISIQEGISNLKKEISILFIGNSLTQDAVSYVPLLLRELAPNLNFKFYVWYNGGYTLAQQLSKFNNDSTCEIFSVCENGTGWLNSDNSVKMSTILSTYTFDVVCLQEYFNYQETANVEAFNGIIEYIEDHYSHPFKVVTLFHQPKRDVATTVFDRTKAGNALFLKDTVAEDMIPSGIAIYRALFTSLDSLGDQGHLSPDGTHAQEGLPCMMQAYVTAMWIMKQIGVQKSVNNASSVVDNSNYDSINVPGPNLGTGVVVGTTEQVRLSQLVAIKAFKEGEYFVNANLTEYTT